MNKHDLQKRTKAFSIKIIKLIDQLPARKSSDVIGRQVLRSATSVAANYRAACRSKSDRDFLNKCMIIEEEADESKFWLELLEEAEIVQAAIIAPLKDEADQLTAIFTASGRTVRERLNSDSANPKSEIRNPK